MHQLADSFVSDPSAHFTLGQSVTALVQSVDAETQRLGLSLKPLATGRSDAAFLHSLFADLELDAQLRCGYSLLAMT